MLLRSKDKRPFVEAVKREVFNERRNVNILIVGKTQMRKSTLGIALGMAFSSHFDLKKHVAIIHAKKLLNMLKTEKFFRGMAVIADDFGVGLNHRQWFSFLNKAINYIVMTYGFRGIVFIVTVPYEKYIDADTRLLFDYEITVLSKNDSKRYVKVKIEELQHTQIKKEVRTYKHFLRMQYPDSSLKRVESFLFGYPPQDILEEYFVMSNEIKEYLQHELNQEAEQIEGKRRMQRIDVNYYIDLIKKEPNKFFKTRYGTIYLNLELIQNEFHLGLINARKIKAGYELQQEMANAPIQEKH